MLSPLLIVWLLSDINGMELSRFQYITWKSGVLFIYKCIFGIHRPRLRGLTRGCVSSVSVWTSSAPPAWFDSGVYTVFEYHRARLRGVTWAFWPVEQLSSCQCSMDLLGPACVFGLGGIFGGVLGTAAPQPVCVRCLGGCAKDYWIDYLLYTLLL